MAAGLSAWIRPIREHADLELGRASRAAAIAQRHEQLLATAPEAARPLHERMARLHRKSEEHHLAAAELHETHLHRLAQWLAKRPTEDARPPRLISAVADVLGVRSAGITLLRSRSAVAAATTASGSLAAAAQDLEFTVGEGPVHDATATGRLVVVADGSLPDRWQLYSPRVTALGVRSLAAAPLGPPGNCVGVLEVFDPPGMDSSLKHSITEIADALTYAILLTDEYVDLLSADGPADNDLMDSEGIAIVHQAAGMVAAQCGCPTADALALIAGRAFADNTLVSTTARRIVERQLRLDAP